MKTCVAVLPVGVGGMKSATCRICNFPTRTVSAPRLPECVRAVKNSPCLYRYLKTDKQIHNALIRVLSDSIEQ